MEARLLLLIFATAFTVQAGRQDEHLRKQGSSVAVRSQGRDDPSVISPALRPTSHDKFFDKDYPDDLRPPRAHKFDHPYPTVQDDEDYDVDYVKDENKDNGYWSAQMEYDLLKAKLMKQRAALNSAKEKMEEEKWEWQDALKKERAAEEAAEAAEEKAADAADALADAGIPGGASGLADKVEEEKEDLKKCEEELREAQEKLEALLKEIRAAQKKADEAADAADKAQEDAEAAEKNESEWEARVKQEKQDVALAREAYEKKLPELREMEKKLDAAAKKLMKIRCKEDAKGGIVNDCRLTEVHQKSGGRFAAWPAVALLVAVMMLA